MIRSILSDDYTYVRIVCLLLALIAGAPTKAAEVDSTLPGYQPLTGLSGKLVSMGSDTLNNLMTFWSEDFAAAQPGTQLEIRGKGATTALQGLMDGSDLGPMTRAMNEQQLTSLTAKFGCPPTGIKVAIDALAVYVHANNPVKSLSLTQVDNIFSSTCKRGGTAVATWGEIRSAELTGEWSTRPVSLFGRNAASGTYGLFKHVALMRGDFNPSLQELQGTSAIMKQIAENLGGIGYTGANYSIAGVRAVPLGDGDQPAVEPTYDHVKSGAYPLSRFIYVYINKKTGVRNELVNRFLTFVLSKAGQQIVIKDGYFPLDAALVSEQLKLLE